MCIVLVHAIEGMASPRSGHSTTTRFHSKSHLMHVYWRKKLVYGYQQAPKAWHSNYHQILSLLPWQHKLVIEFLEFTDGQCVRNHQTLQIIYIEDHTNALILTNFENITHPLFLVLKMLYTIRGQWPLFKDRYQIKDNFFAKYYN